MNKIKFKRFIKSILRGKRIVATSILGNSIAQVDPWCMEGVLNCKIGFNKYGTYCVPLSSVKKDAASLILSGRVYEQETIDFILKNHTNGDIIHAGTFFGDFLPGIAKGIGDSTIWAFEPNFESYRCAQLTMLLNGLSNVNLMNIGLGSKEDQMGIRTYNELGEYAGGGSQIVGKNSEKSSGLVQIKSLDKIIPSDSKISILQLDVEYFEQEALTGSMGIINRDRPIIILENLPTTKRFNDNLKGLGYRETQRLHSNYVFRAD